MMGDDLVRSYQLSEYKSFTTAFSYILDGTKYRPISDLCHLTLFKLFSYNYSLYFFFNILFNFVLTIILFSLIKKVSNSDSLTAFFLSILYITARFSYYNILQTSGILELLCLLLLLLIVNGSIGFIRTGAPKYAILMSIFYLLIVFTHERYLVLLPFLVMVVLLFDKSQNYLRTGAVVFIMLVPLFLNLFLKKVIFKISFLQRTGTVPLDLNVLSISGKMWAGFLKIAGINNGPQYLNLIAFSDGNTVFKLTSISIALLVFLLLGLALLQFLKLPRSGQKKEIKLFVVWLVLFSSLLFSASIAFEQEQRWLYSAFVVFLIYFSYLFSRLSFRKLMIVKYFFLFVFFLLVIRNDIYYKSFLPNLYFGRANAIADSFYDETIRKYGTKITDYEVYVEKFKDYEWILQGSLFFRPYINDKNFIIRYVDGIKEIDYRNRDKILIYMVDWQHQKIIDLKDVKRLVLKRFGPTEISAGQIFNKQPNGESAIWAETENATPTTVFVLNGVPLESAPQSGGTAVSAVVPKNLYEKPGKYPLFLFDRVTSNKSNEMTFIVKP